MPLTFSCFAFLVVHSYLLTVVSALPVIQVTTARNQTEEAASNQISPPKESDALGIGKSEPPAAISKHSHGGRPEVDVEIEEEEVAKKQDDFRPCRISNVTYQHREQIPRSDPCEICVCVDSEMYCLWKLCAFSTTSSPPPSTTSSSTNNQETTEQSINDNKITSGGLNGTDVNFNEIEGTDEKFSKMLKDQRKYNALKKLEATSPKTVVSVEKTNNPNVPTSTAEPVVCYVMGVMYKYGEVLPRDTGTCLECSCSDGGRVTCSPKDCVSQPDLDYLSHNNNLDMFDLDTF